MGVPQLARMNGLHTSGFRLAGMALAALLMTGAVSNGQEGAEGVPLRVLVVGGGPEISHNQVAIESNVRYVGKLLPKGSRQTTLFADGDPKHESVLYIEDLDALTPDQKVLSLLTLGNDSDFSQNYQLRKPNLGVALDGPSKKQSIADAFQKISQENDALSRSLLVYFTGHGRPNDRDLDNNMYDLWGNVERINVRELAHQIGKLPENRSVAIVMVQCYSGSFGNLIFEGGDPNGLPITRDLAGFFATTNDRYAVGCTPAINEADYHDFTSYFFAALTGRDRQGRTVTGADYNRDGHVGMNEAYCYAIIHDASIDVPVCTSDVFLRRFVPIKSDDEVFQERYDRVLTWANPSQRAALEALSEYLHLTGENRLTVAHTQVRRPPVQQSPQAVRLAMQKFHSLRQEQRKSLYRRWPDLGGDGLAQAKARIEAQTQIAAGLKEGKWQDLLDAYNDMEKAINASEDAEITSAHELRFVRLAKSVILAHRLQQNGEAEIKARFARLLESEGRAWLPFLGNQKTAVAAH